MKKNLLLMGALMAAASAMAAIPTDGCTYETKDGLTLTNLWCAAMDINKSSLEEINSHLYTSYARLFTVYNDMIVYSNGNRVTVGEGDGAVSTDYWQLVCYNLYTGEYIKTIDLTCDGEPVTGLLECNAIGVDDFNHLWCASYWSGQSAADDGIRIRTYWVKDFDTGECELVCGGIEWPSDEVSYAGRIDFADITGDITGVEADGVYGAIGSNSGGTGDPYAYRFVRYQGEDEWTPGMDGFASWGMDDGVELYPSTAANFGDGGQLVWAAGSSEIFYANGNYTCPTQYSCYDGLPDCLGNFGQAAEDCVPSGVGATGAYEFVIGDKMYLGYADCQANDNPRGAMSKIAVMGGDASGGTFEGMELMWITPAEGTYNTLSTGGIRTHPMIPVTKKDSNGKTGVYIASGNTLSFLATYLVAEEGFNAGEFGGVGNIAADVNNANAPVVYYNLQGQKVNNPEGGIFIRQQGTEAVKVRL